MIDIHDVVASHSRDGVQLVQKLNFSDGTWGIKDIFDGHLDTADAIELAGEILKAAGGVLQMQARFMRDANRPPRKRGKQPPPVVGRDGGGGETE